MRPKVHELSVPAVLAFGPRRFHMRIAAFASLLLAGIVWLALGGFPTSSRADNHESTCESCAKSTGAGECPYCAAGEGCPHCEKGQTCPHCDKKGTCPHCARHGHHGHHGAWPHKWEYKCVRPTRKPEDTTKQFNALGAEGWRLKQADGGLWCFARMKP